MPVAVVAHGIEVRGLVQGGHGRSLAARIRVLIEAASTTEEFRYPTARGVLRSVDEYRRAYLPAYHDVDGIGARMRRTVELVCEHRPDRPLRMLDYGSGAGTFAWHVAQRRPSWGIDGWDGDPSSIRIADELFAAPNLTHHLRPYDAHGDLEAGSFDVITFLEVIEHVDNPGEILDNFHRALRPGGLLVVSTPNAYGRVAVNQELWRRFRTLVRRRDGRELAERLARRSHDPTTNDGHIVTYNAEVLTALLSLHGLRPVEVGFIPMSGKIRHRLVPDTLIVLSELAGSTSS